MPAGGAGGGYGDEYEYEHDYEHDYEHEHEHGNGDEYEHEHEYEYEHGGGDGAAQGIRFESHFGTRSDRRRPPTPRQRPVIASPAGWDALAT